MQSSGPPLTPLEAVSRFAGHVAAGGMIFALVAVPAILIHLLIDSVNWSPGTEIISGGIRLLEYTIFVIDGVTFVAYLIISAYRLVRELLR
jgi:hypothetical protein